MPTDTAAPNLSPEWLNAQYNNRALVPNFAEHFARWQSDSAIARACSKCTLDVSYGPAASETLDVFPATSADTSTGTAKVKAPVMVFLHGGYWRSLDKSDHSFVAPAFSQRGACVVVPNYALCPGTPQAPTTLPHIALQMVQALAWTHRHIAAFGGDPNRVTVVGHSAGGHLAAMLLACDWRAAAKDLPRDLVKSALSISGLFELESIMRTPFLQESLKLTPPHAVQCSPAWFKAPTRGTLYSVVGGDESAEFLRHNRLIQSTWGSTRVPVCEALPGRNHFSALSALTEPGHRLHTLACKLLRV